MSFNPFGAEEPAPGVPVAHDPFAPLFLSASKGQSVIGGADAAIFLRQSQLPDTTLRQIWFEVDTNKQGFLDQAGFTKALQLVALGQQGQQSLTLAALQAHGVGLHLVPNLGANPAAPAPAAAPMQQTQPPGYSMGAMGFGEPPAGQAPGSMGAMGFGQAPAAQPAQLDPYQSLMAAQAPEPKISMMSQAAAPPSMMSGMGLGGMSGMDEAVQKAMHETLLETLRDVRERAQHITAVEEELNRILAQPGRIQGKIGELHEKGQRPERELKEIKSKLQAMHSQYLCMPMPVPVPVPVSVPVPVLCVCV